MKPVDLIVQILKEIREEMRAQREEMRAGFAAVDSRFQTLESVLVDLTAQLAGRTGLGRCA